MKRKPKKKPPVLTSRLWVHGLGAAVISGVSSSVTLAMAAPEQFNFSTGFPALWRAALVSALVGAAGYLKQSPLPAAR